MAANQDGDVAVEEVFLANEDDVGGLHHDIGRLNSSDEPRVSTIPNASFT